MRDRQPLSTATRGHAALSLNAIRAIVAVDVASSRLITNSAVEPVAVSVPTVFDGLVLNSLSL